MKIYIVKASVGQWEDAYEWNVYASNDKNECERIRTLCDKQHTEFYDAMQLMYEEAETYCDTYIDDNMSTERDIFENNQRFELEKIITVDLVSRSDIFDRVSYTIVELEVDIK